MNQEDLAWRLELGAWSKNKNSLTPCPVLHAQRLLPGSPNRRELYDRTTGIGHLIIYPRG